MNSIKQITSNISHAITILHLSEIKTLIVLNKNKFIKIKTGSDVRRGLLNKFTLDENIFKIINKKSITTFLKKLDNNSNQKFLKKKVYYSFNSIEKKIENLPNEDGYLVIMAEGKGKKLLPLTKEITKSLNKIKHKPIIEKFLEKNYVSYLSFLRDKKTVKTIGSL